MKRNAVTWTALIVSVAALVSSRGLSRPIPAAPSVPAESRKVARALSEAFVAVADFVKPSVVQISVQRKAGSGLRIIPGPGGRRMPFPGPDGGPLDPKDFKDFEEMLKRFFGPNFRNEKEQFGGHLAEGTGSGFVYDDQGHILTNNHVVDGAGKITVTFQDGIEASATVVGTDKDTDVAVIKVDNTSYPPLPRGSSGKLRVGDLVMAVGSPFGLSQTVTTGIISATERNDVQINSYESFLQTDAAINPGNSGGPLVNMDGQVVGINSAIVTGSRGNDGVGFAIPIDMAANVADKLIKDGRVSRARIGIALGPLTPAMAKQFGHRSQDQGRPVQRGPAGQPGREGGPEGRRRHHQLQRPAGRQRPGIPPERRRQRHRPVLQADLPPQRRGAHDHDRPRPLRQGRLRAGEGVVGRARDAIRARQDVDQRLRPGGPAFDFRAGPVARHVHRPPGVAHQLGQGG